MNKQEKIEFINFILLLFFFFPTMNDPLIVIFIRIARNSWNTDPDKKFSVNIYWIYFREFSAFPLNI